jgi:energy-coupling factor transporter ATP-binding protein EcfA2
MQLEAMWVHGYRRFGGPNPVKLRLDAPLVCLVGANEVGKSTLLDALELGYSEPGSDPAEAAPVGTLARTRSEQIPDDRDVLRLRYRLQDADRKLLAHLHGAAQLTEVCWLERIKKASGAITTELVPTPGRDKKPRKAIAAAITTAQAGNTWPEPDELQGTAADPATLAALIERLESTSRYVPPGELEQLLAFAAYLDARDGASKLAEEIREVVELERLPHPREEALAELEPRVPRFVRFNDSVRNLADDYDLEATLLEPPPAFENLANLAQLDRGRLLEKIQTGETGTVKDIIDEANETLQARFESWTQKPQVTVSLDHSGTVLSLHVKSGSATSMRIGERSDGLRQFVALVALTAQQGHQVPPIILIDEVEQHLHYDAQADLIGVLQDQTTAAQVIYTTHSAAALPEDLGSAVRVVRAVRGAMLSTVEQQFWSEAPGMGALLLALGAGSLAFVPLRPAVIVEGGGDLILLPSLIKEASDQTVLGFQIVPGAAGVPPTRVAGLDLNGVKTVWILDGDDGGRKRRYAQSVNAYVKDLGGESEFDTSLLPAERCVRHRTVEEWCKQRGLKPPSKTAIATKVLDLRGERRLVDPQRRVTLRRIHRQAIRLLAHEQPDVAE